MNHPIFLLAALALLAGCANHGPSPWTDSSVPNYPRERIVFTSGMVKSGGIWTPNYSPGPIAVVYAYDDSGSIQRRAFCVFKGNSDPSPAAPPPVPNQTAPPPFLDLDSTHAQPPAPVTVKPYWWEYIRGRWPIRLTHNIVAGSGATTIIVIVETLQDGYQQSRVVLVGESNPDGTPRATSVTLSLFGSSQPSITLNSAGPADEWFVQVERAANGTETLVKYDLDANSAVKADVDAIKAAAAVANLDDAF
ncbi:MAG: hypothetical protein ACKVW3_13925 [Phycisphaerales bacterium]